MSNVKCKMLKKGFTLVELLVVISILGVLAGLVISNVQGIRERARDSQRKSDLQQIKEALRMYKNDFGTYPVGDPVDDYTIEGCGSGGVSICFWGNKFMTTTNTVYISPLPNDPSNTATSPRCYFYVSGGSSPRDNFALYAVLENASDPDSAKSVTKCGVAINDGAASGWGLSSTQTAWNYWRRAYFVCSD